VTDSKSSFWGSAGTLSEKTLQSAKADEVARSRFKSEVERAGCFRRFLLIFAPGTWNSTELPSNWANTFTLAATVA